MLLAVLGETELTSVVNPAPLRSVGILLLVSVTTEDLTFAP